MKYIQTSIFLLLLLGGMGELSAQSYFRKMKEDFKLQPYVMLQLWSTYTQGQEVWDAETESYRPVDDRLNLLLRRGRFGIKGEPYRGLSFNINMSFDLIGRDVLAGTVGGINLANPKVVLWDAMLQWKVLPESEALYFTGGYFRPQIGRENITSAWSVSSMEKSMVQNYLRRHIVGTGPGRSTGLNLGGLLKNGQNKAWLQYNLGIFTPLFTSRPSSPWFLASGGSQFSPLLVGRVVFFLGDPEMDRYRLSYKNNFFNARRGVSLGISGSWQGQTEFFKQNTALNLDLLANYGPFNIDIEADFLHTLSSRDLDSLSRRDFAYPSFTGHIRMGYNLIIAERYFLEPSFMAMVFRGAMDAEGQADANSLLSFSGQESTFDLGLNWYLNKRKLKLALHYTWRAGSSGAAGDGALVNQYYLQGAAGPVRRGDWLGFGVNVML